jgi:voltage-gated potassium channel
VHRSLEILGVLVRPLAIAVLLVVAYFEAPLDRRLGVSTAVLFAATLLLLCAFLAVEVRGILRSVRPRLRAIRAVLIGVPMLLVVFAATYSVVDAGHEGSFSEPMSRTDCLYFTVTVFSTVGFGDITARSELARVLVTIQMIIGLVAVGVIARLLVGAVRAAETRQGPSADAAVAGVPRAVDRVDRAAMDAGQLADQRRRDAAGPA